MGQIINHEIGLSGRGRAARKELLCSREAEGNKGNGAQGAGERL